MASPRQQVFFLYDSATGAPVTGRVGIAFDTYKDHTGTNLTPPAIVEIGGGAYGFTPTLTDSQGIVYVINAGGGVTPQRLAGHIRPEDFDVDQIQRLVNFNEGRWEIKVTGPDANRLILYAPDGVTVLKKFELRDHNGVATFVSPFARVPVS